MTQLPLCRSLIVAAIFSLTLAPRAYAQLTTCESGSFPTVPMSAVIASGRSLASDGRGAYVDGKQGSTVNVQIRGNLYTTDPSRLVATRYAVFNLTAPVAGDLLSQPLGAIRDARAEVHLYYKLVPAPGGGLPYLTSVQEIPLDGVFHTIERIDLHLRINGAPHILMFGGDTYPLNICNPSNGALVYGPGTTKAQILRLNAGTYVVQSNPGGSVGRLYDYSNPFNPIDRGLHNFSFSVTWAAKSGK